VLTIANEVETNHRLLAETQTAKHLDILVRRRSSSGVNFSGVTIAWRMRSAGAAMAKFGSLGSHDRSGLKSALRLPATT